MYTRPHIPCRNTECLIFLFIFLYYVMIPLRFVVSVDGAMGHDGSAFLQCLTNGFSRQG